MENAVILREILIIFFVGLFYYLGYRLFVCRPKKQSRGYRRLALGILQFPILIIIGYLYGSPSQWPWPLFYAVSFIIFIPLYIKFCRTYEKKPLEVVETESDENVFSVHCTVCGRNDEVIIPGHISKIYCQVCGNIIERAKCIRITKCPHCKQKILWDRPQRANNVCPSCGHVLVPPDGKGYKKTDQFFGRPFVISKKSIDLCGHKKLTQFKK